MKPEGYPIVDMSDEPIAADLTTVWMYVGDGSYYLMRAVNGGWEEVRPITIHYNQEES